MTTDTVTPAAGGAAAMTAYELQVWEKLNAHWQHRSNPRGLPNWASTAIDSAGGFASEAAGRVADDVSEAVNQPLRRAGGAVASKAVRPVLGAAAGLLELVNDWALELKDPRSVEKLVRKRGIGVTTFAELRDQDLKVCDRLLTANALKWRAAVALEGGSMGLLALIPVVRIPVALTADILVIQILSTSIAARIAHSYGYDAKDPAEQAFIQRLVQRSFNAQAAKAKPLNDTARAAFAVKDRVRWSAKLRENHRLLAALEKLMNHIGPHVAIVPVQSVAKLVPVGGS